MEKTRATRRDATENRRRLLEAAEAYFGERGLDASMHGLAQRAGLGIGTLYRHFPEHADLVRALYDRLFDRLVEVETDVLARPTAWEGIEAYVDGVTVVFTEMRAGAAVMERMRQIDPAYRPADRFRESMAALVARAHAEGRLRPDVTGTDIAVLPYMLAGALRFPEPMRSVILARQKRILLDGLGPAAASVALPGSELPVEDFHEAAHGQDLMQ